MFKVINGSIRIFKNDKLIVTSWKYISSTKFQWAVQCVDESLYEKALLIGQDFSFTGSVHFTSEQEYINFMKEFDKVVNSC